MKFILDKFPGTFLGAAICICLIVKNMIAAQQSVQLTAIIIGLGFTAGFCIGVIYAAYEFRRN